MRHSHKESLVMACTHVIDEGQPIGKMVYEVKSNRAICQKCIDKMTIRLMEKKKLPAEVHFVCKYCVIEKLKENKKLINELIRIK